MTAAPPSPRVTTERVARYIDAHRVTGSTATTGCGIAADLLDAREWIASMGAVIAEWQAAQRAATERIAELEATIENDQGHGEPPSPGWTFDGDIRWTQPFGPRVTACVVGEWLIEDATGPGDAWVVIGRARTARRAMRDTDAARGPG